MFCLATNGATGITCHSRFLFAVLFQGVTLPVITKQSWLDFIYTFSCMHFRRIYTQLLKSCHWRTLAVVIRKSQISSSGDSKGAFANLPPNSCAQELTRSIGWRKVVSQAQLLYHFTCLLHWPILVDIYQSCSKSSSLRRKFSYSSQSSPMEGLTWKWQKNII